MHDIVTLNELSQILQVSQRHLHNHRQLLAQARLQIGRAVRYRLSDVITAARANQEEGL